MTSNYPPLALAAMFWESLPARCRVRRIRWVGVWMLALGGFVVGSWLVTLPFLGAERGGAWLAERLHVSPGVLFLACIVFVLGGITALGLAERHTAARRI